MLKKLRRKKTAKKVWIILAIIIVPAFVLWGLGGAIRSQKEAGFAGKIFGKKISLLEYKDAMDAVRNQAIIQFGDNFSEIQKYLNLESQAWERLILLQEAEKRKIKILDQEVIELIESYPFFQKNGQFNNAIYSQLLHYYFRTPERAFEEQARQNLMLTKLYKQITDTVALSEKEIKEEYLKANEEISIYYIAALFSDFQKDIAPTPQDLKDYFAKNSLEFKQPLSFNLEYLSLDSEEKIKNAFLRLNKRQDLTKVAGDFNAEVKETGLFSQTDSIPGIGWAPDILALISKLKVGQFCGPIQMDKQYYILRLKERKEPYIPDFESVKDKVKEAFIKNKAREIAKEKIEIVLTKLKEEYQVNPKSIDFNAPGKACGLKSDSTGLFKYGSYIEGIGASDNFWTVARELKEGGFSEIIDVPLGFYIIKLKSRPTINEKKFEKELGEFSQKLLQQKKQEYFSKFIETLRKKAQIF